MKYRITHHTKECPSTDPLHHFYGGCVISLEPIDPEQGEKKCETKCTSTKGTDRCQFCTPKPQEREKFKYCPVCNTRKAIIGNRLHNCNNPTGCSICYPKPQEGEKHDNMPCDHAGCPPSQCIRLKPPQEPNGWEKEIDEL
jgi:hypothetical protein